MLPNNLTLDQIDNVHSCGLTAGGVVTGTNVEQGIASEVQGTCAFKGHTHLDLRTGIGAIIHIIEIDVTVHCGINDFNKSVFCLFLIIQIHNLLGFVIPADNDRLACPTATGPGTSHRASHTANLGTPFFG